MSDDNRTPGMAQWGRPLRKRGRLGPPQPGASDAPAVGPVDHPLPVGGAETIIRSGPVSAPRAEVARRDPDDVDLKFRDLVKLIARGLVDSPEAVEVDILDVGHETSLELSVNQDDLGHVIGKQGRTARSLRLVLGAAASLAGRKASLEIAD